MYIIHIQSHLCFNFLGGGSGDGYVCVGGTVGSRGHFKLPKV